MKYHLVGGSHNGNQAGVRSSENTISLSRRASLSDRLDDYDSAHILLDANQNAREVYVRTVIDLGRGSLPKVEFFRWENLTIAESLVLLLQKNGKRGSNVRRR
ncbi:MAG TPA: hypothetical protein VGO52_19245 [Hyphomonadaceae bacterium]|jgi:hypothetical protein|nr:hypothetical protein [Hyphomonadaceae bacterium]